eukprot:m51a1_g4777 putative ribosome biogenesis atpase rix7 (835) ;mRNA; f:30850-34543
MSAKKGAQSPYFVDRKLLPRIKQFAAENPGPLDAFKLVDHLRNKYPEYQRKTVAALRTGVEKALQCGELSQQAAGAREDEGPQGGDADSDVEVIEQEGPPRPNALNDSLVGVYHTSGAVAVAQGQAQVQLQQIQQAAAAAAAAAQVTPARKRHAAQAAQEPSAKRQAAFKRDLVGKVAEATGFDLDQGVQPPTPTPTPKVKYADLGGIESALQDIRELIEYPLTHPEIYTHLGVDPPRGILLHGPPGCGKTLLANAIAGELGVPFFNISAPEFVSGMSGESEAKLRALFSEALKYAPCLIFIDEIDAITPKRDTAQREMERRIVAQLLTCLDKLGSADETKGAPVIVIGATNRPDALDPALRRAGRFDREISLGIPDTAARARILRVVAQKLRVAGDFDYDDIAKRTPGFVGADLSALAKEAAVNAVHRIFLTLLVKTPSPSPAPESPSTAADGAEDKPMEAVTAEDREKIKLEERTSVSDRLRMIKEPLSEQQLAGLYISKEDFDHAITKVQPSAKREGFSTIPNVKWTDVGALSGVRSQLLQAIVGPIRFPEMYSSIGISTTTGILLFGPPGCGKTLIAKAVANECGANFIGIKGPQLLNKYVGEAEKAVRQLFNRARSSAPCIIFFDELDALCPRRASESDSTGASRVVNQLLTEMDGLEKRKDVFVIAATNRPDVIDPAMLRPGRLDKLIAVELPDAKGRAEILRAIVRAQATPLAADVDVDALAVDERCEGFSGADLAALVKEASQQVLNAHLSALGLDIICDGTVPGAAEAAAAAAAAPAGERGKKLEVTMGHFIDAFRVITRSVSKQDEKLYRGLGNNIRHINGNGQ